jgi:hypothetical protein
VTTLKLDKLCRKKKQVRRVTNIFVFQLREKNSLAGLGLGNFRVFFSMSRCSLFTDEKCLTSVLRFTLNGSLRPFSRPVCLGRQLCLFWKGNRAV